MKSLNLNGNYLVVSKKVWSFLHIFEAFSEYVNLNLSLVYGRLSSGWEWTQAQTYLQKPWIRKVRTSGGHLLAVKRTIHGTSVKIYQGLEINQYNFEVYTSTSLYLMGHLILYPSHEFFTTGTIIILFLDLNKRDKKLCSPS